ncbi:MAG: acyltransferase [Planctomycetes bacterium]|nr:acyltransferase [Planctomycetota bacterium]
MQRNIYLDCLRGVAMLMVMVEHLNPHCIPYSWLPLGANGVWIFFTLSGYLITNILIRIERKNLRELLVFYARRSLRIFPLYYLTLGLLLCGGLVAAGDIWWLLTYTINIKQSLDNSWGVRIYGHFWSLAVEEQFYLFWPILVFCLSRNGARRVISAFVIAAVMFRMLCSVYDGSIARYVFPVASLDCLGLGSLLAFVQQEGKLRHRGRILVASLGLYLGSYAASHSADYAFLASWFMPLSLATAVCCLISIFVETSPCRNRWLRPLAYVGQVSYCL